MTPIQHNQFTYNSSEHCMYQTDPGVYDGSIQSNIISLHTIQVNTACIKLTQVFMMARSSPT